MYGRFGDEALQVSDDEEMARPEFILTSSLSSEGEPSLLE